MARRKKVQRVGEARVVVTGDVDSWVGALDLATKLASILVWPLFALLTYIWNTKPSRDEEAEARRVLEDRLREYVRATAEAIVVADQESDRLLLQPFRDFMNRYDRDRIEVVDKLNAIDDFLRKGSSRA